MCMLRYVHIRATLYNNKYIAFNSFYFGNDVTYIYNVKLNMSRINSHTKYTYNNTLVNINYDTEAFIYFFSSYFMYTNNICSYIIVVA